MIFLLISHTTGPMFMNVKDASDCAVKGKTYRQYSMISMSWTRRTMMSLPTETKKMGR